MLNTITISVKAKDNGRERMAHNFKPNEARTDLKSKIESFKSNLSKMQTRGSKMEQNEVQNGGRKVQEKTPEQCLEEYARSGEEEK